MLQQNLRTCGLGLAIAAAVVLAPHAQSETFTATASIKNAAGAAASAPVTIVVDRKMPQAEADKFLAAFKSGGTAALRKALTGVAPTGSVRIADGPVTPTRLTIERPTDKGRLLTIVADQPVMLIGAASGKPKEGYDFAIIDIQVDSKGAGEGTFAPAAKVTVKDGVFVVDDYSGEIVKLAGVSRK